MAIRVKITLPLHEYAALTQLALSDLRTPPDELRHILRQELERHGLLPADVPDTRAPSGTPEAEVAHANA